MGATVTDLRSFVSGRPQTVKGKRPVKPFLPGWLSSWVGPDPPTQEPAHGTTQGSPARAPLAPPPRAAFHRRPVDRRVLLARAASPLPRSTTGSGGSPLQPSPAPLNPPLFVPLRLEDTRPGGPPSSPGGVELELPHQVRLRFDSPPEPEWLGRVVAAIAGLAAGEANP